MSLNVVYQDGKMETINVHSVRSVAVRNCLGSGDGHISIETFDGTTNVIYFLTQTQAETIRDKLVVELIPYAMQQPVEPASKEAP